MEENVMLKAILTRKEIKNIVLEMHPLKAPGPDGMGGSRVYIGLFCSELLLYYKSLGRRE